MTSMQQILFMHFHAVFILFYFTRFLVKNSNFFRFWGRRPIFFFDFGVKSRFPVEKNRIFLFRFCGPKLIFYFRFRAQKSISDEKNRFFWYDFFRKISIFWVFGGKSIFFSNFGVKNRFLAQKGFGAIMLKLKNKERNGLRFEKKRVKVVRKPHKIKFYINEK